MANGITYINVQLAGDDAEAMKNLEKKTKSKRLTIVRAALRMIEADKQLTGQLAQYLRQSKSSKATV